MQDSLMLTIRAIAEDDEGSFVIEFSVKSDELAEKEKENAARRLEDRFGFECKEILEISH